MAQHDYVIANGTGAAVRSDLNNALAAIVSQNSGATAPATTYAYQFWADTTTNLLKLRNSANSAWITLFQLDGEWSTLPVENGTAAAPSIYFKDSGTDTGFYSPGTDQVGISTGGTARLTIDANGNLAVDTNTLYVDAPNDRVGIGTSTPSSDGPLTLANAAETPTIFFSRPSAGSFSAAIQASGYGNLTFYNGAASSTVAGLTPRMTIDGQNGRVGIGTTGPVAPLNVQLPGVAGEVLRLQNGGNAARLHFSTDTSSQVQSQNSNLYLNAYDNYPLLLGTNNTERARIDTSGRLLVGTSTARTNFFNSSVSSNFQIEGTAGAARIASIICSDSGGDQVAGLILGHQKSGAVGGNTILASGDAIGRLSFQGSDGSEFVEAAFIQAEVDGTPGANDMPGRLMFSTTADGASSPTERMRIDQGGHIFGSGMTALSAGSSIKGFNFENSANNGRLNLHANSSAGTANGINFYHSGAGVGSITYSSTNTAYNTSSDYRLKENVIAVTDGIARLQQLKPSRFNFKIDPAKTVDGFIAHEVQTVVPEAVHGIKDEVDDDGNPVYQGIDQSKLVPLLTAALQEAVAKIESLEARLTAAGI